MNLTGGCYFVYFVKRGKQKNIIAMEKTLYVAPETEEIKIGLLSVICWSEGGAGGDQQPGGGDPE